MEFNRGQSPKKSLDVGLSPSSIPGKDRHFLVRFRLRESRPDYYPLQEGERRGESVVAVAVYSSENVDHIMSPRLFVKCYIPSLSDEHFYAHKDSNGEWEIAAD